jgi:hypothetical protein
MSEGDDTFNLAAMDASIFQGPIIKLRNSIDSAAGHVPPHSRQHITADE